MIPFTISGYSCVEQLFSGAKCVGNLLFSKIFCGTVKNLLHCNSKLWCSSNKIDLIVTRNFDFDTVNFPFLDGDVPRRPANGVHISCNICSSKYFNS